MEAQCAQQGHSLHNRHETECEHRFHLLVLQAEASPALLPAVRPSPAPAPEAEPSIALLTPQGASALRTPVGVLAPPSPSSEPPALRSPMPSSQVTHALPALALTAVNGMASIVGCEASILSVLVLTCQLCPDLAAGRPAHGGLHRVRLLLRFLHALLHPHRAAAGPAAGGAGLHLRPHPAHPAKRRFRSRAAAGPRGAGCPGSGGWCGPRQLLHTAANPGGHP